MWVCVPGSVAAATWIHRHGMCEAQQQQPSGWKAKARGGLDGEQEGVDSVHWMAVIQLPQQCSGGRLHPPRHATPPSRAAPVGLCSSAMAMHAPKGGGGGFRQKKPRQDIR